MSTTVMCSLSKDRRKDLDREQIMEALCSENILDLYSEGCEESLKEF